MSRKMDVLVRDVGTERTFLDEVRFVCVLEKVDKMSSLHYLLNLLWTLCEVANDLVCESDFGDVLEGEVGEENVAVGEEAAVGGGRRLLYTSINTSVVRCKGVCTIATN